MTIRDTLMDVFGLGSPKEGEGKTPEQQAFADQQRWTLEMQGSDKFVEKYITQAQNAVDKYRDEKTSQLDRVIRTYRLNLYHSNINILKALLYAKLPKVEADRRFLDPNDDVARVAGEMITRILENDMNDPEDGLDGVLRSSLDDRLIAGLGVARVKYGMEEADGAKKDEWCDVIYTHWRDVRCSPARVKDEITWKGFRSFLDEDALTARFGAELAKLVPMVTYGSKTDPDRKEELQIQNKQAEVWEIWDKKTRKVFWWAKGMTKILEAKDDPLGLEGFYPDGDWMVANATTTKYLPKPDYVMTQDLYEEIDELESRIALLTQACKAIGVYDAQSKELGRMLTEGVENMMIPVNNWAMFAERGGLKGMTDWLPVEQVANTIQILSEQQQTRINQLYQVTGMSDIMRGQASAANVTATEQKIKAQFASVRVQALQEEFARFAESLLNKKVQIIRKFYDPERIVKLSNIMNTPDKDFAGPAVQLIKGDATTFNIRISVKAESMAQINYDQLRQERSDYLTAVGQYFGMAQPLLETHPESAPFVLQLLSFGLAGYKAGSAMEGLIDQAISAAQAGLKQKEQEPKQPSPEEIKAQSEQQKMQQEAQIAGQQAAQEAQQAQREFQLKMAQMADEARQAQTKAAMDLQQMQQEHIMKMDEMAAQLALVLGKLEIQKAQGITDLAHQEETHAMDLQHAKEMSAVQQEQAVEKGDAS